MAAMTSGIDSSNLWVLHHRFRLLVGQSLSHLADGYRFEGSSRTASAQFRQFKSCGSNSSELSQLRGRLEDRLEPPDLVQKSFFDL